MPATSSKLTREALSEASVLIDKGEVEKANSILDGFIASSSSEIVAKQLQARALMLKARLHVLQDVPAAKESCKKALALSRESMDRSLEAETLCIMGNIEWKLSQFVQSLKTLEKALDIARSIKDRRLEGIARLEKATILTYKNETTAAEREFREAILALETAGDMPQIARAYNNLACVYVAVSRHDKAAEMYAKSKKLAERIGYRHMIAWGAYNLGDSLFELGKFQEALAEFEIALPIFKAIKDPRGIIAVNQMYGLACAKIGKWPEAEEHFNVALRYSQKNGSPVDEGKTYFRMGLMYKWRSDKAKAKRYFQKALIIFEKHDASLDMTATSKELSDLS